MKIQTDNKQQISTFTSSFKEILWNTGESTYIQNLDQEYNLTLINTNDRIYRNMAKPTHM